MVPMNAARHSSIEKLRTWFHLGAIIFIVAVALATQQYVSQVSSAKSQAYLAAFRINAELKTKQIDLRFRLLTDHVLRMRNLTELAYSEPSLIHAPILQAARHDGAIVGYGLEDLSDTTKVSRGNFFSPSPTTNPASQRELDIVWQLFPVMANQHQLDDAIRWSGFVSFSSGNFAAYPFVSVNQYLKGAKEQTIKSVLLDQYHTDFFQALQQSLKNHDLLWRAPSLDQAGTGFIVSLFAPIYHDSTIHAYVLADVQLDFIQTLLRSDLPDGMKVQLATIDGDPIADTELSQPEKKFSSDFFRAPTKNEITINTGNSHDWQVQGNYYLLSLPLATVVWNANTLIKQTEVSRLVDADLKPLKAFQFALTGLMLLLWWLLSHFIVTPSLKIAELAARHDIEKGSSVPRIWLGVQNHLLSLISERQEALTLLRREREHLEEEVQIRTRELQNQNAELEAFNFAVSHDLRAPVRAIDGFVTAIQEDNIDQLDSQSRHYLSRVKAAIGRMEELIEALISLSHLSRALLKQEELDLSDMAEEINSNLANTQPNRTVKITIEPNINVFADRQLMRIVLDNLFSNAWKYSSRTEHAHIEFGTEQRDGETVYKVADNGAGFDMFYAQQLFTPFQRMHRKDEFEGTGIGLSTVQRIIHRHGGQIWAEAEVGKGATIRFTLSPKPRKPA